MNDQGFLWHSGTLRTPHAVADKAERVRRMFDAIAPTYERINRLFSGGRDAAWRKAAVRLAQVRADDEVLDVACGTGDFARGFAAAGPRAVVGCDFSHEMLLRAIERKPKAESRKPKSSASAGHGSASTRTHATLNHAPSPNPASPLMSWCEADALHLPFADGSFSIASCAFGVRNFQDLSAGLAEMHRVLRPGGRVVILEFTRPPNAAFRAVHGWYSGRVMPVLASWISGDRTGAYRYLPRSIESFLSAEQMTARLCAAGFARVSATPMTFGVVTIYMGHRA